MIAHHLFFLVPPHTSTSDLLTVFTTHIKHSFLCFGRTWDGREKKGRKGGRAVFSPLNLIILVGLWNGWCCRGVYAPKKRNVPVVCDMLAAELKVTQEFGKVVVVVSAAQIGSRALRVVCYVLGSISPSCLCVERNWVVTYISTWSGCSSSHSAQRYISPLVRRRFLSLWLVFVLFERMGEVDIEWMLHMQVLGPRFYCRT